jgi:hypothetical protein
MTRKKRSRRGEEKGRGRRRGGWRRIEGENERRWKDKRGGKKL